MPKSATTYAVAKKETDEEPRVRVFIPLAEEDGSGLNIEQVENVTINGVTTLIKRGEYVDVTVPVFVQLRNKYPNI